MNEWDDCERAAHEGLRLLGENSPRGPISLFFRSVWEVARFVANLPRTVSRKMGRKATTSDIQIIALYRVLIENYVFRNRGPEFIYASLRMTVISQTRIGPSKELSISLIGMALIFAALARFKTAMKLLERALRLSLDAGDRWCEAYAYGFRGLVSEFMGNYREGMDRYYSSSMNTFREIGDIKNIGIIHIGLAQSLYFLSEYDQALFHNGESHSMARKIDDRYFTGMALTYYCRLYREKGDFREALRYGTSALDYNRENSLSQNYCAALTEMGCLLRRNTRVRPRDGTPGGSARGFRKRLFQQTAHRPCLRPLRGGHAGRLRLTRTHPDERGQKKILRKIRRLCRLAEKNGRLWKSHLGKAYRVQGTLNALTGRPSRAEKYFRRSVEDCRRLGNSFDLARALYEYGLFLAQHRREGESRDCLESAYEIFGRIGARNHAGICGKILGIEKEDDKGSIRRVIRRERDTSLKRISGALGKEESRLDIAAVIDRIIEYLGAPDGCLFASASGEELSLVYPAPDDGTPRITALRRAAEKVLESGKTGMVRIDPPGSAGRRNEPRRTGGPGMHGPGVRA